MQKFQNWLLKMVLKFRKSSFRVATEFLWIMTSLTFALNTGFFPDLSLDNCIYFPWLILKNIVFSLSFWVDLPVQIWHSPILWQRAISNNNDLINTIVVTSLIIFRKNFLIQLKLKSSPTKQNINDERGRFRGQPRQPNLML